jgi:hypothetical protein
MASSKQKTTMNKLNRERKLRERRLDKEARKVARMNAPAEAEIQPGDPLLDENGMPTGEFAPDPAETGEFAPEPAEANPVS